MLAQVLRSAQRVAQCQASPASPPTQSLWLSHVVSLGGTAAEMFTIGGSYQKVLNTFPADAGMAIGILKSSIGAGGSTALALWAATRNARARQRRDRRREKGTTEPSRRASKSAARHSPGHS